MRFLLATFFLFFLTLTNASEKTKEQWLQEAKTEAERMFMNYHAVCNGKVIVRAGIDHYYEFSGNKPEMKVLGLYHVQESDRLNGKLWSGKLYVKIGASARLIEVSDGSKKVSSWNYGRDPEFDFVFQDGKWQLDGEISSYSTYGFYLQPKVSCARVM